ncbi:Uncharacterized protein YR821_0050 [Yersinia ruckeri]|uniref:Uncharacterized protein n=1 Tax=Yersinia ruckeri TaxID=29486 RepID=A0A0A8V800_YERRU|nr:hypothetical protein yruck0001_29740 [Yersinia ruckeri ATCC 29473]QTD74983.1 Uncharacterized protein YR821_0050 [Yersinia ruckeri]CEK25887.1 hypothetical protein CSF007_0460 [Yersinia ruckeri]
MSLSSKSIWGHKEKHLAFGAYLEISLVQAPEKRDVLKKV